MKRIFSISLILTTLLLTGCIDLAVNHRKHTPDENKVHLEGQVYTMRGGLGGIFSKGMNHLEDTLVSQYHIQALSTVWFKGHEEEKYIVKNYRNHKLRGPIVLAGHSLGANEQVRVAKVLGQAHIPVALLITVDPVMPTKIPSNVKHAMNIYKPSFVPMLSGLPVKAVDPRHTQVDNINVEYLKNANVNHLTIDSNKTIQKLMEKEILQTLKTTKSTSLKKA